MDMDFIIRVLLWVDVVIICVEGEEEQEQILEKLNEFAIKHKLKWGQNKCNVMRVGKHDKTNKQWKLGELTIEETTKYKYLGDIITPDGKNTENLQSRFTKLQATTININTIASSEVLYRIETSVLLHLYEKKCIPGLLTNAESWTLSRKDEDDLEKMEISAVKSLFNLPVHTPTVAIIFSLGLLYTIQRVDQKQLIYLHRLLNLNDLDWYKKTLYVLKEKKIGWFVKIKDTLEKYNLPLDFDTIRTMTRNRWVNTVKHVIERKNTERLKSDLYKRENGIETLKTKTKSILDKITNPQYTRQPEEELLYATKNETKAIIISRYGMLECGSNFKGKMNSTCSLCNVLDDESHRFNVCPKWNQNVNQQSHEKINFSEIYSPDIEVIRPLLSKISSMWNTKCANGTMIK